MENLVELLYQSASKYPDQPFIITPDRRVTYREMLGEVHSLMFTLYNEGVRRGDRIVLYCKNSAEYIATFFATAALNAVVVPMSSAYNVQHLKYVVDVTEPALIIADLGLAGGFSGADADRVRVLQSLVKWDKGFEYVGRCSPYSEGSSARTAMILFTSGTSALPKGVMLSHRNLLSNTRSILDYLRLTPDDSVLVTLPFSYSYGNSLLLTHAAVGGTLYLENYAAFPVKVVESLKTLKPTGFSTVGSYLNLMLKAFPMEELGFSSLKYITFAGESTYFNLLQELQRIYPKLRIYVMYGQTEASARLSYLPWELLLKKPGSVGRGIKDVELKVVDEQGIPVAPREIGEIVARGPNIMQGYWRDEEETQAVLRDGWLHTGDIATVDRDGFIYIQGRNNDIIKYLGHRISPMEIEGCIEKIAGVVESAVVEAQQNMETCIKAYVVTNGSITADDIKDKLREMLPPFKRPSIIQIVQEIPRTVNGKVRRAVLREAELCVG